ACLAQQQTAVSSPTAARPTRTPIATPTTAVSPSKTLVICMGQEPDSLYPYGTNMAASQAVLAAIFEPNITAQSYDWQAHGLETVPTLENGGARLETAVVQAGDIVLNSAGDAVVLQRNIEIINDQGETVLFADGSINMKRLVVDFTLKPRIWADGVPVTAADSVFSYQLQRDAATPTSKFLSDRTARYEAINELTTRWVGIPGFMDATYFTNFFIPLPQHTLQPFSASELLQEPAANRLPLGDGPFKIVAWEAGSHIELTRNEYYYRAEGFPRLDGVIFKFVSESNQALAQLLAGSCDLVTADVLGGEQIDFLLEAEAAGRLTTHFSTGTVFEHIDFGINSQPGYGDGDGRPDWFEDVRVRQAITQCTDRQSMVDNILYGRSQVIHSYIPPMHPLYPPTGLTEWPYNVMAANRLLNQLGYVDSDGDGIREEAGGEKRPFSLTLLTTSGSDMRQQIAQIFQANLRDCGIEVNLDYHPPNELFSDSGSLFQRQFDLAEFAWATNVNPPCELFLGDDTSNPTEAKWNPSNTAGWHHPGYDAACKKALSSLAETPEFIIAHQEAQRIWSRELPVIPLFLRLKVAATRPEVTGFQLDPTEDNGMVNLYRVDITQK
ncbi:MAG: peptide ABC transporter substrate-binding protein, partial [Anaerolineales bacterium]|nr:peptide ABC transporter substrate-binding protein [Anaerolineales bacterium]